MFQSTQALAFAVLLFQQPGEPRAERPHPVLDPALRVAVEAFHQATSFRFEADVDGALGQTSVLLGLGAPGPALADWLGTTRVRGGFERGKPLFLASGQVQAFRAGETIVFKERGHGGWSARGELETISHRVLSLLGHLPSPEELIDDLEVRVSSCRRLASRDAAPGEATFECQLKPEASRRVERGTTACALAGCTLRLTVKERQLVRIEIDRGATPESRTSLVRRYRLMDIGRTEVAVPTEAARLLGSR